MLGVALLVWSLLLLLAHQFVKEGAFECGGGAWSGLIGLVCAGAIISIISVVVFNKRWLIGLQNNSYLSRPELKSVLDPRSSKPLILVESRF